MPYKIQPITLWFSILNNAQICQTLFIEPERHIYPKHLKINSFSQFQIYQHYHYCAKI